MMKSCDNVLLKTSTFGSYKDASGVRQQVNKFTWTNPNRKTTVEVINWGATITSIQVPDKDGKIEDIVTGFDSIEEYLGEKNGYYGATIGRVANRIARATMTVDGVRYQLAANNGPNHLHGGVQGFDKVLWNYRTDGTQLILTYNSPDLDQGYPGALLATVTFQLTDDNDFAIDYKAVASRSTPVNLTNHSYFNLAGHGAGWAGLKQHDIVINADRYTEVDPAGIPTGRILNVSGSVFDLRVRRLLADVLPKVPDAPGFDHNFCIQKPSAQDMAFVAEVQHRDSGRSMALYSNQPGVQFYTGNFMPEDDRSQGKLGETYRKHGAFCLETQNYPDAINQQANFPAVVLRPGEQYHHVAVFKFRLLEA